MKTAIIAASCKGIELARRLKDLYPQANIYVPERFCIDQESSTEPGSKFLNLQLGEEGSESVQISKSLTGAPLSSDLYTLEGSLTEAVAGLFNSCRLLIFISAAAVAVRAIAPCLKSKAKDPAVVVIDEQGCFSISLLSGHLGGANEEAEKIAGFLNAQAVITTATDGSGLPAFDDLARRWGWKIENLSDMKKISAALLENKPIMVYSEKLFDFPLPDIIELVTLPEKLEQAINGFVVISTKVNPFNSLPGYPYIIMRPKTIAAGVGCRRGVSAASIINAVEKTFIRAGLSIQCLSCLATGEFKAEEPGLMEAAEHFAVPLKIFDLDIIKNNLGESTVSEFVEKQVGVGAVAEPCARLGSDGGDIVMPTIRGNGITVALAEIRRLSFS